MSDVTGPYFAWRPIQTWDRGRIWLRRYWTSGFFDFANRVNAEQHYARRGFAVDPLWSETSRPIKVEPRSEDRPSPRAVSSSVIRTDWHADGEDLICTYEVFERAPPETKTHLKVAFNVSRAPNGSISTCIYFDLRPYLYLLPNRSPLSDGFVKSPFRLSLFGGAGAGTETSPVFLGGVFDVLAFAADPSDDLVQFWVYQTHHAVMCRQVFSSAEVMTFCLIGDEEDIKARFDLPNDRKRFRQLYKRLNVEQILDAVEIEKESVAATAGEERVVTRLDDVGPGPE
jgi:hypothetical protein